MSEYSATVAPSGGVALLERAVSYALGALHGLGSAELHRSTPCRAWTLADLLTHLTDSVTVLQEAADHSVVHIDVLPEAPAGELVQVAQLRAALCRLLGAWTASGTAPVQVGGCPLAADLVAGTGAVELTVHGWDIGMARGIGPPIPPRLAGDLLALLPWVVTAQDRPGRFGEPVCLPPRAGPGARLLAHLGRAE